MLIRGPGWCGTVFVMPCIVSLVESSRVGVASPIMFCLYIDELLLKLADSGVGCRLGKFYVGVLAYLYADDIVL